MSTQVVSAESETLSEAVLGKELLEHRALTRIRAWPAELRASLVSVVFASLVLLPYLGSVGLWDPWETHYGEVAREMVQRNDYVHPFWENAWFFSKPAFTMWMQAAGMQGANLGPMVALLLAALGIGAGLWAWRKKNATAEFWGALLMLLGGFFAVLFLGSLMTGSLPWRFSSVAEGPDALPLYLEWGFRLPFAGFSILAIGLLSYALAVTVSARAAMAATFVLATMPLYFLLSRQAVTDTPIVSATIAGLACTMVGVLDKTTKYRSQWFYAAYVFFAVATLAKGLLGFGVPMLVFLGFVVLGRLPTRQNLKLVVFGPLFLLYPALALVFRDSKSETFSEERWFGRNMSVPSLIGLLAGAVIGAAAMIIGQSLGTTFMAVPIVDNKTLIPAHVWLGIMWGSLGFWAVTTLCLALTPFKVKEAPPEGLFRIAFDMRLGTGILLFLAVCLPWYYEMFTFWRLDDESKLFWFRFIIHDHFARLGSGVHTTTPGGDFTYFILQGGYAMWPWVLLVPAAFSVVGRLKIRGGTGADGVGLIAVLWFAISWALIGNSATKFHHYVFPMLPPLAILMGIYLDKLWQEGIDAHALVVLLGVPLFVLVGKDLIANPKNFTDLFVYNYDRPYPSFLTEAKVFGDNNVKQVLGLCITAVGLVTAMFAFFRLKAWAFTAGMAGVVAFTLWFNWSHWVALSHHWTQRDQFWRYYSQRNPDEPIAAFLMNWRGETFYSRNTVKQIKDNPQVGMANYAALPGRKWSLVEHNRLGILEGAVGGKKVTKVNQDLNNKFVLVTIE